MGKTKPNGAFTTEFAKRKNWKFNQPLGDGIAKLLPSTFVDVGAGTGRYVLYFQSLGIGGYGIDGIDQIDAITFGHVIQGDVSVPLNPHSLYPAMHTAISIEVGEHIPPDRSNNFINNLCRLAKEQIIISWATPGQRGESHINCREPKWVREQFEKRAFIWDEPNTKQLRRAAGKGWQTKLWVLRRSHHNAEMAEADLLKEKEVEDS